MAEHKHTTTDTGDARPWPLACLRPERLPMVGADATAAVLGISLVCILSSGLGTAEVASLLSLAAGVQVMAGCALGLYRGRFLTGSFDELPALCVAVLLTTTVTLAMLVRLAEVDPLAFPLQGSVALLVSFLARGVVRVLQERRLRPPTAGRTAVVVCGAGDGGERLVRLLLRDPDTDFVPVAFIDDDPAKLGLRVNGVEVEGTRTDLPAVLARHGASTLVIAIPSATPALLREIDAIARPLHVTVTVLPTVGELLRGEASLGDIRPLNHADLLGRRELSIDVDAVARHVTGRRVLVTGAGGSIGSELCRQLSTMSPERLVMLDRDESSLHTVQLALRGHGLLEGDDLVVADIRDARRMDEIFAQYQPHVVFHTAALKHLTLLERHPSEAVKTNVRGTWNLLQAALAHGTERFVNISTDKAARPSSVLGWSKRIGERLTAAAAEESGRPFVSVRFGNVLGSRGSVLTSFHSQIAQGQPLTVTHPDATRFFMTVEEAVRLVVQAAAVGSPGEVLVLDMGTPVRILDVAQRLLERSDKRLEIVYTGLRPGEKLHEVLHGEGEVDLRPCHPLISHAVVPALDATALDSLPDYGTRVETVAALKALCDTVLDLTDDADIPAQVRRLGPASVSAS